MMRHRQSTQHSMEEMQAANASLSALHSQMHLIRESLHTLKEEALHNKLLNVGSTADEIQRLQYRIRDNGEKLRQREQALMALTAESDKINALRKLEFMGSVDRTALLQSQAEIPPPGTTVK